MLTGKDNATVKKYAALKDGRERVAQGLFLLEGERLIADAVRAGAELEAVFIRGGGESKFSELVSEISLKEPACAFFQVADTLFPKLCGTVTPQGIVAAARVPTTERPYGGGDALILDGVRDPGNLGTLIRSAAGFGFADVYLIDCADAYGPKAVRSSMSAIFHINLHVMLGHSAIPCHSERSEESSPYEILNELKRQGVVLVAADMNGADLKAYKRTGPVAVAVGGEARGISKEVRAAADSVLAIRTEGIESLNAAVAGSIFMYALSQ
ncbi:rRNA methyltransferase [Clostridia bacterium]|nr:rRNA methyltransferase [Clostridia bacterium]